MLSDQKYNLDFKDTYLPLPVLNGGIYGQGGICSRLEVSSIYNVSKFEIYQMQCHFHFLLTVPDWPLFLDWIKQLLAMEMNSSSTQPPNSLRKAREQQQQVS